MEIRPFDPKVYVIILNWNGMKDTVACINSLVFQEDIVLEIVIVDNGSTDHSVNKIRELFPQVHVIENGKNLGFSGGMNVGIQSALSANGKYILVLNNDTIADKGMVRGLLDELTDDVGITAPVIFYEKQPDKIWSVGGNIHPLFLELLHPHGAATSLPSAPLDRDFVTGCAMLVRSDVFHAVGMFDERFSPAYYEDLDFSLRVRKAGFRIVVVPATRLLHKVSQASGGERSPFVMYLKARNSAYYFRKHMQYWQIPFIFLYRFLSAIKISFRLIIEKKWDALAANWAGLFDGWIRMQKKINNSYLSFYEKH